MKRLHIMIEDDLDVALAQRAAQEGVSKAALVRRFVRAGIDPLPSVDYDRLWGMFGADPHAEPGDIKGVVYG